MAKCLELFIVFYSTVLLIAQYLLNSAWEKMVTLLKCHPKTTVY